MEGKKKYILTGIVILLFIAGITVTVVNIAVGGKGEKKPDDLVIFWETAEITMNVGEYVYLKWESNREIVPFIFTGDSAVNISTVREGEVVLKAFASGYDTVTLQAENQSIVCVIKVNEDLFRFDVDDAVLGVGAAEIFYIKAEPKELLKISGINYSVENREVVKIKEKGDDYIELLGLKKGLTYVNAEWRGKSTGFMVEVVDDLYRSIIVPQGKQYLFVGQETQVKVYLDESEKGDEYGFKYTEERNKGIVGVSGENNVLKVKALRVGEQYVRVTHPKAKTVKTIYFDVIEPPEPEPPRIETSESPMILRKNQEKYLEMYVVNGSGGDIDNFKYRIVENSYAVEITQNRDRLLVRGVAPGAAKVRIMNSALVKEYDVMIIVE